MQNSRIGTKLTGVGIGHTVVKPHANAQQHVAIVHRHIGFIGPVHTQHAEELRVGCRISTEAHKRVSDWIAELLCKLG